MRTFRVVSRPRDTKRPFSIEYNAAGADNGYYIAYIRGYAEFLKTEKMRLLLDGWVATHLSQLENPTRVEGEWPQLVHVYQTLINVIQKPKDFNEQGLTLVPKSVVKVMRGPFVKEDV